MDGFSAGLMAFAACFVAFLAGLALGFEPATSYDKFAAECTQSTIQTQYAEQGGQRAMVVKCERAK